MAVFKVRSRVTANNRMQPDIFTRYAHENATDAERYAPVPSSLNSQT